MCNSNPYYLIFVALYLLTEVMIDKYENFGQNRMIHTKLQAVWHAFYILYPDLLLAFCD
jgi:hypothetical protein